MANKVIVMFSLQMYEFSWKHDKCFPIYFVIPVTYFHFPVVKMATNFPLLNDLLQQLEQFEITYRGSKPATLPQFTFWLHEQLFPRPSESEQPTSQHLLARHHDLNQQLAVLVHTLGKQLRGLVRQALADSVLVTLEDHMYLSLLADASSMRKMELIAQSQVEVAAGVEIIRRLLKHGHLKEAPDTEDRRSKRVSLTPAGRAEFERVLPQLSQVADELAAPLNHDQKLVLVHSLTKLANEQVEG